MTRRELLRLAGLAAAATAVAPFTGVEAGTVKAAAAQASKVGPWKLIAYWSHEYGTPIADAPPGTMVGFCGIFQHQETRQLTRNAVLSRIDCKPSWAKAKELLMAYREDLDRAGAPGVDESQRVEVFDQFGTQIGWHFGAPWKDSDYGGYKVLGCRTVDGRHYCQAKTWILNGPDYMTFGSAT